MGSHTGLPLREARYGAMRRRTYPSRKNAPRARKGGRGQPAKPHSVKLRALGALPQRYLLYTWTGDAAPAQVLPQAKMYENHTKEAGRGSAPATLTQQVALGQRPQRFKKVPKLIRVPLIPDIDKAGIAFAGFEEDIGGSRRQGCGLRFGAADGGNDGGRVCF